MGPGLDPILSALHEARALCKTIHLSQFAKKHKAGTGSASRFMADLTGMLPRRRA